MAVFNAYNLRNQRLDSENMRVVLQFCSDNYAGAIASSTNENPVTVDADTNKVTFACDYARFIVGGYLVDYTNNGGADDYSKTLSSSDVLYGLVIPFDIENTSLIGSVVNAQIGVIQSLDDTSVVISYENESFVINDWVYNCDSKLFTSVTVSGVPNSLSNCYVIPFACFYDGKANLLLGYHTKSSLEEYLTEQAFNALKAELDELYSTRFVWQSGGVNKGNIGDLNITDNTIINRNGGNVVIDALQIDNVDAGKVLLTDSSKKIVTGVPRVDQGGTGATDKDTARRNLGISSGGSLPTSGMVQGDIFLKIIS